MIATFQGCSRSEIKVIPNNWRTKKASVKKQWVIYYRFYDPAFKNDKSKWGKQFLIRGMNEYMDLAQRQEVTADLIKNETEILDRQGFNPITRQFMAPQSDPTGDIPPSTPFIVALRKAHSKLNVVKGTKNDINSIINNLEKASEQLRDNRLGYRYVDIEISQISRRHIKSLLDYIGTNNPRWSNNRFNLYRAYISMLFKELLEMEATEVNPARDIASKKKVRKLRAILTPDEERRIDEHLKQSHYYFWRFIRVFFDSQARETELMQLKKDSGVRIHDQEFNVIVKKGKETREAIRVISKDLIPLWLEIWNEAKPGEYLFSKHLKPGSKPIRPDQLGRRWNKYVKAPEDKGGLGISKDLYALKALSTDKMDIQYGIDLASAGAGHTNTTTTIKHYAVGHQARKLNLLKGKKVAFAETAG